MRVLELAATPVPVAVAALGRNCHMPNALQTPLHVILHVEHMVRTLTVAAADVTLSSVADGVSKPPLKGHPLSGQGADPWVAVLPQQAYAWGVRLAIREGGCCASRAAYVGACLGAMTASASVRVESHLPEDWLERYPAVGNVRMWAEAVIVARRRQET